MKAYFRLIRLKHWIKNSFVLAPLIFSLNFLNTQLLVRNLLALLSFCLMASFVYIMNDILDRKKDREHPEKKNRPLARGEIPVWRAAALSVVLLSLAVLLAVLVNIDTLLVVSTYLLLNLAYTLLLKHIVILDVMVIATGFILRVLAGAVSIGVDLSHWMLLTTLFISLFLGFSKRRSELARLNGASNPRPVLSLYSVPVLDYLITISLALTIITYSVYVIEPDTVLKTHSDNLIYTVPFVVYAMFRYLYLTIKGERSEDIAELILKDKGILIAAGLWAVLVVVLLYLDNAVAL